MAPQQYIAATGYSSHRSYHPASLPTYGAGLNGASTYPWGATNNQFNTTGNYSGVYDPVRDCSGAAGHHLNPNTSNYANNGNNSGDTGTYPNAFRSEVYTQLNNSNDYGTSQSQNQHHYDATQFNIGNSYGNHGPFYNTNQYNASTQLSNGNSYGAIGTNRNAYQSIALTHFNNGNYYGSSSFQSQNTGFYASRQFNSGSNHDSRIPTQQEHNEINNNFRRLPFRQTPGHGRPGGIQKRTPARGFLGRHSEAKLRVANLLNSEARASPEIRVRSSRNVTPNQESNINIPQSLPSPELQVQSLVWYRDWNSQAVQEPQEVQPAQEEHQQEVHQRPGEPRIHTAENTAMNMLTRSFLDDPPTANPNARMGWLRYGNDNCGPPTVEPNEKNFHKKMEESLGQS